MKRTIDGAVYDTDTSTKLGRFEYEMCNRRQAFPCNDTLYPSYSTRFQTRMNFNLLTESFGDRSCCRKAVI
jgi:hypothetical protein